MRLLTIDQIGLRPAQLKALQTKAESSGRTASQYIRLLVERDLLAEQSLSDLLAPIRQDFKAAGVTEKQLDQIVKRARNARPRGRSR